MSTRRFVDRLAPHSVPVLMFALVAVVALVVPPLTAGSLPLSTSYLLTFVFLILAVTYSVPYAAAIAVVTLPVVVWSGTAGYASPEVVSDGPGSIRAARHVAVGFLYGLASAFVGSVFIGAELAGASPGGGVGGPAGALFGGVIVGLAFVALQLWRYWTLNVTLDRQTSVGTTVLGLLLALSPVIAYWLFGETAVGL